MADLRKEVHGAGSMKGLDLAVIAYDNRVARKDDKITTRYLDVRIHPGDRRAEGQTQLALVSKKDEKSPTGYNNSERYSEGQFEAIVEAAGDNVTDLTNKAGDVVGKIYGVNADLLVSGARELVINTKTVKGSELSVAPNEAGVDIRQQMFDSMKAAQAAREAAKATEAETSAPEASVEAPAPEEKAEKSAPKKAAPKKRAPAKKAAATAEAEAAVDEPALG